MEQEVKVRLDWSGEDGPVQPANVVLTQGVGLAGGQEVVLTFGYAAPPIGAASLAGDDLNKYLASNPVPVQQISRVTLSVPTATTLAKGLAEVLRPVAASEES